VRAEYRLSGGYRHGVTGLTSEAARSRAELVAVDGYQLDLDLTVGVRTFRSSTTIRFRATGASTFVDVAPAELRSATLNGAPLDLDRCFDPAARRLTVDGLQPVNELVVDAIMSYSHDGEGLHRHVDPADGLAYVYAMSFLDAAPRWFACFDQPDLKAPVRASVSCPADWVVFGNGPASEVEPGRWTIAPTAAIATYFTTLVAGPYHVVRDKYDGVPLSLSVRRSLAEHLDRDAEALLAHTKRCLDEFHKLFEVRYPWGAYHQAFVPEFNAGAMENPGCVTFRDTLVFRSHVTDYERVDRDVTIAHEMAHMWFGDLVTMRWWDDLWLNESFAEYLGSRVTGEHSWIGFGIRRKSWGYAADRRPSTHPVAGNGVTDAASALAEFDGISYAKGASVLRQLAVHLGDDLFLDGLRRYIRTHAGGNAEFADLISSWSAAGAADLAAWSQAWLRTTGLDELSARRGVISRRSADNSGRVHTIVVASYGSDGTDIGAERITVTGDETPIAVSGTLVLPDALDETWAKVVLPDETWRAMPELLTGLRDTRSRVAIWNALQLAVADAEVDPARAIDIVATALPAETDDAVIGAVGRWAAERVAGCYLDDVRRDAALTRLAGAMLAVTDVASPGSSRQLAAARAAIATTADVARLRAWLVESDLPDGLVVDAELRWAILHRLAVLGALDAAAIDDEAARDHSAQGGVHAARCHAARPDARAKRVAWEAIMRDAERPNYELYALAEGFWEPGQRRLTDEFVARYFAEVPATVALRSGWVVEKTALLAYPSTAVDAATLAATERLLADQALDSRLRRSLTDAGDDLRRALVARTKFPLAPDVA
jgi:aminopeptidase N